MRVVYYWLIVYIICFLIVVCCLCSLSPLVLTCLFPLARCVLYAPLACVVHCSLLFDHISMFLVSCSLSMTHCNLTHCPFVFLVHGCMLYVDYRSFLVVCLALFFFVF